jgi:hypothetical protein
VPVPSIDSLRGWPNVLHAGAGRTVGVVLRLQRRATHPKGSSRPHLISLMVVAVTGSIPRVRLDTVVPETVPQTYSMSVRPSSSVKQLKPENGAAPRTVADTRERNVSVELMRS